MFPIALKTPALATAAATIARRRKRPACAWSPCRSATAAARCSRSASCGTCAVSWLQRASACATSSRSNASSTMANASWSVVMTRSRALAPHQEPRSFAVALLLDEAAAEQFVDPALDRRPNVVVQVSAASLLNEVTTKALLAFERAKRLLDVPDGRVDLL